MRITTGIYKGRNLLKPKGIRPTQDKVRKAVFDILGDIEGLSFLELFAGSGAVGLEALSRGAKGLFLVENDPGCISILKQNMEVLKVGDCVILTQDVEKAIQNLHKNEKVFDIVFLDPPYHKTFVPRRCDKFEDCGSGSTGNMQEQPLSKKTLQMIGAYAILAPNGFVIVQHSKKDNLPDSAGDLILYKRYKYGDTFLSVYRKHVPNSHLSWDI